MVIRRGSKPTLHRKAAVAAGLMSLAVAAVSISGALVFSPDASARLGTYAKQLLPNAKTRITQSIAEHGLLPGKVATVQAAESAEDIGTADERDERNLSWLRSITEWLAPKALDSSTVSLPEGAEPARTESGSGTDEEPVLTVTEGDIKQAAEVGQTALGFWATLWSKLWPVMEGAVETLVG